MSKDEKFAPMDAGAPEVSNPVISPLRKRNAYALDTLIKEVAALYPEATATVSQYDGRNTALAVTFDVTESEGLADLMELVSVDRRVLKVVTETLDEITQTLVVLHSAPRIQDLRDSFNLESAFLVLAEEAEREEQEDPGFGLSGFGS